ncbi:MAG: hypothetical protein ABW166_21325, partial [Sedimenticola sp.]
MPDRDLNLGNTVIPLTASLNGQDIDSVLEWLPLASDANGRLSTETNYPVLDTSPLIFVQPYVIDINETYPIDPNSFALLTASVNYLDNPEGDDIERETNNYDKTLLTSAARSSTVSSSSSVNKNSRGGHFSINVTAIAADATITPVIQGLEGVTLSTYDILVGSTISTVGT